MNTSVTADLAPLIAEIQRKISKRSRDLQVYPPIAS